MINSERLVNVEYSETPIHRLDVFQYYEHVSSHYEGFYEKIERFSQKIQDSINCDLEAIKTILSTIQSQNIIDLGCGTSYWSNFYMPQNALILIDASPKMLNISKNRLSNKLVKTFFYHSDFFNFNKKLMVSRSNLFFGFILSHYNDKQIIKLFKKYGKIIQIEKIIIVDSVYGQFRQENHLEELYKNVVFKDSKKFSVYKRYFNRFKWLEFIKKLNYSEVINESYWGESFFISTIRLMK